MKWDKLEARKSKNRKYWNNRSALIWLAILLLVIFIIRYLNEYIEAY